MPSCLFYCHLSQLDPKLSKRDNGFCFSFAYPCYTELAIYMQTGDSPQD